MEDDGWAGGRIVLEAHSGHQVNEESIALLSELGMFVDYNPSQDKQTNKQKELISFSFKVLGCQVYRVRVDRKLNQNFQLGSKQNTNLRSSEGFNGKSSWTGCMQRGQYIWPGPNHILIHAKQYMCSQGRLTGLLGSPKQTGHIMTPNLYEELQEKNTERGQRTSGKVLIW